MMEGMSSVLLVLAMISTGLYAGYMFAFLSGVMPALREVEDAVFVGVMRQVNVKVPRPAFLLAFLGSLGFPAASVAVPGEGRSAAEQALVIAALVCVVLGHLVTVAGNVPLNNALADSAGQRDDRAARAAFESRWNTLHRVRTVLAVAAFPLLTIAAV